jgi:hypothetical protein
VTADSLVVVKVKSLAAYIFILYPEDGGSMLPTNVGNSFSDHTASHTVEDNLRLVSGVRA